VREANTAKALELVRQVRNSKPVYAMM